MGLAHLSFEKTVDGHFDIMWILLQNSFQLPLLIPINTLLHQFIFSLIHLSLLHIPLLMPDYVPSLWPLIIEPKFFFKLSFFLLLVFFLDLLLLFVNFVFYKLFPKLVKLFCAAGSETKSPFVLFLKAMVKDIAQVLII